MKKTIISLLLLASATSFAQLNSKGRVNLSVMASGDHYITITGNAAKVLFEEASNNSDEVTYYDDGISAVYKNDLACTLKKSAKSSSYSCSILLQNGKAITAPRG